MTPEVGAMVALYNGEGGKGEVLKRGDGTALVRFTDGAKVWCSDRNLTIIHARPAS